MNFCIKHIRTVLFLIISCNTYGQVCEDSVQIFGLYANESFVNHSTGLTRLTNGNYAYLAWPLSTEANGHSGIVITNAEGQFIKGKNFISTGYSLRIYKMASAPNGGIIMLGSLHSKLYTRNDLLIVKLDDQLNILWSKRIKVNNSDPSTVDANYIEWAIHCNREGIIYFSFYSEDFPANNTLSAAFVTMNAQGNIVWSKSFELSELAVGNGYKVDGITTIGDNVFFIGKIETSGFIAFSFNRLNGNYNKINKVTHTDPGYSISFNHQEIDNVSLFPSQKDFYFAFEARNIINQTTTLYHFLIDSFLQCTNFRKIKNVKYGNPTSSQFGLSQNGELAFTGGSWGSSNEANCLAVIDRFGNTLISKKISNSFFQKPDIRPLLITDSGQRVNFSVTNFPTRDSIMKFDVPLLGDSSLYNCIGKDTVFFNIESAAMQQQAISSPVFYPDLISAFNIQISGVDFTLAKQEYCKVKSTCSSIDLSGNSSFCSGTTQTFQARKNTDCLKKIAWNTDTIPATVINQTDSTISLRFNNQWNGYIISELSGCGLSDSVYVQVRQPLQPLNLGNDKELCPGKTIVLTAPAFYPGYLWNTGEITNEITINQPGIYYLTVPDQCGNSFSDTIEVKYPKNLFTVINLGSDRLICPGRVDTLTAPSGFASYLWNTGSTINTIIVDQPGIYNVKITDACDNFSFDTINLIRPDKVFPNFDLGRDTALCPGASILLTTPTGFANYEWSTGQITEEIIIRQPGKYSVIVKDICGNSFSDTIEIRNPDKIFPILSNENICLGDSVLITKSPYFSNYTWQPNIGLIGDTLFFLNPETTTAYAVQVQDEYGCLWNRRFNVTVEKCTDQVWFPSGFTPNQDGLNDSYGPIVDGRLQAFSFKIYNRWGEIVFASGNPLHKWNGKFKEMSAPAGVYVWVCNYQFKNEKPVMKKGSAVLIR